MSRGVESRPVFLHKIAAAFALSGLMATSCVADTSLCRIMCASRAQFGRVTHHHHDAPQATMHPLAHRHMGHPADMQKSVAPSDKLALNSAPCSQYQPLLVFLDGARASFGETISSGGHFANLLVTSAEPNRPEIPFQVNSPSPPQSNTLRFFAPTLLRI